MRLVVLWAWSHHLGQSVLLGRYSLVAYRVLLEAVRIICCIASLLVNTPWLLSTFDAPSVHLPFTFHSTQTGTLGVPMIGRISEAIGCIYVDLKTRSRGLEDKKNPGPFGCVIRTSVLVISLFLSLSAPPALPLSCVFVAECVDCCFPFVVAPG